MSTSNLPLEQSPSMALARLPLFLQGPVVRGFGRGSKELGVPTANFPEDVVSSVPSDLQCGVYYGWAQLDGDTVHKSVLSIGYNPFYNNTKMSVETHIIHKFTHDFYGSLLRLAVVGYLRPETNFSSVEELTKAIHCDIATAQHLLDQPPASNYKTHSFFKLNGKL